jgi:outer membrane protein assembly factor BamB/orotate phosphoribosyltransferase
MFEAPRRDMRTDDLRDTILRSGVKRNREGALLISRKGNQQEWLLDLRPVFLQRHALKRIAAAFWARYKDRESFQLGGVETAAIPLLTALLLYAPKEREHVNGFIIRKERKTTGLGNAIEGFVSEEPIVLIDDIVNSGASADKARVTIEAHGRKLSEMFVVVDYRSKRGLAWRDLHGIQITSLYVLAAFGLELRSDPPQPPQRYGQLWRVAVPGGYPHFVVPKSTPLLVGDRIYRGCDAGKMQAFDSGTGAIVWEYQATGATPRKGIWSSPAVHDGRLYFGAYNGNVYCLAAADGREIWARAYGEWVGASPLVVPGHALVYFGIEYERPWAQGSIAALAIESGDKVWEYETTKFQHGSPAHWRGGDLVIWGTADHEMVALDAATGSPSWVFRTRRSVKSAPAVDEDRGLVGFASFDKSIYILDVATGAMRGQWETGDICYTTPLFCGNKLFCGSGDRHLYVIDVDRMQLLKKLDLGARVYSSPCLLGRRVIVGTSGGKVFEIDIESLEIRNTLQLPDAITNAVVASPDGRRIFVSTYMNHLYSFECLDDRIDRGGPATGDMSLSDEARSTATINQFEGGSSLDPSAFFLRVAAHVDVREIRREILAQPTLWNANTSRQRRIKVQRETQSIFLRAARKTKDGSVSVDDIHASKRTKLAAHFPETMKWVHAFARRSGRELGRVLLAKLKPGGRVYPHVDDGEYYKIRDRFHLVVASASGADMQCGGLNQRFLEGELWWFDNKKVHSSSNPSNEDRIHLIFDLQSLNCSPDRSNFMPQAVPRPKRRSRNK